MTCGHPPRQLQTHAHATCRNHATRSAELDGGAARKSLARSLSRVGERPLRSPPSTVSACSAHSGLLAVMQLHRPASPVQPSLVARPGSRLYAGDRRGLFAGLRSSPDGGVVSAAAARAPATVALQTSAGS